MDSFTHLLNLFVSCLKEAIAIRKQPANMNRDEGQFYHSHLYDDLLVANANTSSNSVTEKSSNTVTKQSRMQCSQHRIVTQPSVLIKITSCYRNVHYQHVCFFYWTKYQNLFTSFTGSSTSLDEYFQ